MAKPTRKGSNKPLRSPPSPSHMLINSILIQTDDGRRFDSSIQYNRIIDDPFQYRTSSHRSLLRPLLGGIITISIFTYLLVSESMGFSSFPLATVTDSKKYLGSRKQPNNMANRTNTNNRTKHADVMIEGLTLADDDVDDELQTEDDDTQDADDNNGSVENMEVDEQDNIIIDKDEVKEVEEADAKDLEADYAYIKSKAHKQTYSKEETIAEKHNEMANNNNTTDTPAYENKEENEGASSIDKEEMNLEQDGVESDENYEEAVEYEEQEADISKDGEPKRQYKDKGTLRGVAIDKSLIQEDNNTGEESASIDEDDDDDDNDDKR